MLATCSLSWRLIEDFRVLTAQTSGYRHCRQSTTWCVLCTIKSDALGSRQVQFCCYCSQCELLPLPLMGAGEPNMSTGKYNFRAKVKIKSTSLTVQRCWLFTLLSLKFHGGAHTVFTETMFTSSWKTVSHSILLSCCSLLHCFIMGPLSPFSRVIISILRIPSKTGLVLLRKDWKKWKKVTCQLQSYTWRLLFCKNPMMQRYLLVGLLLIKEKWFPLACGDGMISGLKPLLVMTDWNRLNLSGSFGIVHALK